MCSLMMSMQYFFGLCECFGLQFMDRDYKKGPQHFLTTKVDIDPLLFLNTASDYKLHRQREDEAS